MSDDALVSLFQTAVGERNWPYIAVCVIFVSVRIAKLPIVGSHWDKIPRQYRPLIPVGLGVLSGVGEALLVHRSWLPALLFGVFSGLMAIGADQALTKPLTKSEVPPSGEGTKT